MNENYLTLKQLIEIVDIPENSCKRYLQEHEQFLNYKKVHNRYMIHVSAVETLKIIRKLYGEGLKKEAVDEHLNGAGVPVTITMDSEEDSTSLINVNAELQEMKKMMHLLFQKAEDDKKVLLQEIADLKQLVNRKEADKITELRKSLEDKQGEAEAREKEQQELFTKIDKTIEESTDKAVKEALNEYKEAEGNKSWWRKFTGK